VIWSSQRHYRPTRVVTSGRGRRPLSGCHASPRPSSGLGGSRSGVDTHRRAGVVCRERGRCPTRCAEARYGQRRSRAHLMRLGFGRELHPFASLVVTKIRVSRGDEVNGLALNNPWIARLRDACLEPWGRTSKQPSRSHSWSVPMRTPSPASVSENTWPRQIAPQTTRTSQSRCGGRSTPHGSGDTFQSPRAGWRVLVSRSERRRRSGVAGVRQPALHSRLRRSGGRRPAAGERRGAQAGRARAVPERPSRRAR